MWVYRQSTGEMMSPEGIIVAVGYSGSGVHKNDPDSQNIVDQGPIPQGDYEIDEPIDSTTHGPYALPLIPSESNEMFGRSGFMIHGDSLADPGCASEGCIIMPPAIRHLIWASGDRFLVVKM